MGMTRKEKFLDAIASGNKTNLPAPVTREEVALNNIAQKGLDGVQSDWNQDDDTSADFIKNKPTIPDEQVNADWNESDETSKAFIQNKPVVAIGSADGKEIFLNSSTAESTKVFSVTVTDDGTLTATEVVATE